MRHAGVRGGSALAGRVCVRGLWRVGRGLASIAGASRLPTLSKADLGAGGNRVPPHALAPAYVVSRCLGAHEPEIRSQCSRAPARARTGKLQDSVGLAPQAPPGHGPTGSRPAERRCASGRELCRGRGGWSAGPRDGSRRPSSRSPPRSTDARSGEYGCVGCPTSPLRFCEASSRIASHRQARCNTDGWPSYQGLAKLGFRHTVTNLSTSGDPAHVLMSAVHRVASLLKRWVLGTLQGGIAREHLPYYLDEFTFRFNRRTSRARGLLFYRLLEQAVQCAPTQLRPFTSAPDVGNGRRAPVTTISWGRWT